MRYMGGKHRQGRAIADKLCASLSHEKVYIEPFCGALGAAVKVIPRLHAKGVDTFILSDNNESLITFWSAVQAGWLPPEKPTKEQHAKYRLNPDPKDPCTAYYGHALSYGGRWFGGFIPDIYPARPTRSHHAEAYRSVLNKIDTLSPFDVSFKYTDYTELFIPTKSLVYLDPPYADRKSVHAHKVQFDTGAFWAWAEICSLDNTVFVSEFSAPANWDTVHSFGNTVVNHSNATKRPSSVDERLFKLRILSNV